MKVGHDVPVFLILFRDKSRVMAPSMIPVQYGKGVESRGDVGEGKVARKVKCEGTRSQFNRMPTLWSVGQS
jgi:hypothetical protein